MKFKLFIFLFFCTCTLAVAQQFSYKPLNPAFGGDTFNYNWLISSANAQNGFTQARTETEEESELDRFGEQLNQQVLSQISRALLAQQVDAVGDFNEEGTFTFGSLNVEVFESDEGLVINILDTLNGEQTQVIVPNP
ncbi:curli production assembly/transport component CsgF [Lacinutrix venerupis]|uniref:Curli production assembly/transport component CsgF n=1 Tax=Lacinutrix venerupis TaxID=1486034 RepID=A0AAC9LLQ1_9FLAO|nr:curli production assembly/transport component CsgF [Lacinutrix venerupis]APX99644.1 curli assembly protein CsgF [Lacinutrix venerupis]RLJ61168.1 curli production assembly/transport component CsgF [Lacinutrix venerupis]